MIGQNLKLGVAFFSLSTLLLLFGLDSLTSGNGRISGTNNAPTSQRSNVLTASASRAVAVGSWTDIAPFPTVTVSPTPGSYPLRLKRAGAAAYPPNGKIYLLGGRH